MTDRFMRRSFAVREGFIAEALWDMNGRRECWGNILGILVTAVEDGKRSFHGIPLEVPEDDGRNEDKCVMVATSSRHQRAIYHNLYAKGYRDVVLFSEAFCGMLLEKTERQDAGKKGKQTGEEGL